MFGYASLRPCLMPAPVTFGPPAWFERQSEVSQGRHLKLVRRMQIQVTCRYDNGKVVGIDAIRTFHPAQPEYKPQGPA